MSNGPDNLPNTQSNLEAFSSIYKNGLWGRSTDPEQPFYSGPGSHDNVLVSCYVQNVLFFIESLKHKPDVVDLGCGDFNVGARIRPWCDGYIACDVVSELVDFNKKKYHALGVDFRTLDMAAEDLPPGEVVFIRQVLQHLSNEEIAALVPKLYDFKYIVLTEHLPINKDFVHNLEHGTGPGIRLAFNSGVVLTSPPFNFVCKSQHILCEVAGYGGRIQTMLYVL